jgi:hypothetical protein
MDIGYHRLPFDGRVILAISLMQMSTKLELVREALGQRPLDSLVINVIDNRGTTLFHAVASTIGRLASLQFALQRSRNQCYNMPEDDPKKDWLECVRGEQGISMV